MWSEAKLFIVCVGCYHFHRKFLRSMSIPQQGIKVTQRVFQRLLFYYYDNNCTYFVIG